MHIYNTFLFLNNIGPTEWIIIGIIVLVLFGAKKIPDFAKGVGKGIREFKDAMKNVKKEVDEVGQDTPRLDDK